MGFGQAVGLFFSRYADFQGRSRRAEYWWVALAQLIFYFGFGLLFVVLGGELEGMSGLPVAEGLSLILLIAMIVVVIGLIIPNLALAVRRFHDLGQTGWLVVVFGVIGLIPIVGSLASLGQMIWFAFPGTVGPNQYGSDPKNPIETGVFD